MTTSKRWQWNESLLVFDLYCRTPFGQLHHRNPEIISLAENLNRSPSSVAMKASNFASLDPRQAQRGIKGLSNASQLDREVWEWATTHWSEYLDDLDDASRAMGAGTVEEKLGHVITEAATVRVERRAQGYFRRIVLTSYGHACALTGLAVTDLLNASHIVPWAEDANKRLDPTNGISLNTLHDRAFDRGLITFDESLCLITSSKLRRNVADEFLASAILCFDGNQLRLPDRFAPSKEALEYHRDVVFQS